MMTVEKRHFDNPFPEFAPHKENNLVDLQTKKIHTLFLDKLKATNHKLMEVLEQHLPSGRKDGSVYTGTAGVALLYLMMHEKINNPAYLEKAADLIEKSLARLKNKDVSFICGDAGPLSIASVIFYKQNKVERSKECVSRLLGLMPRVASLDSNLPDELLYGRVGYLYSLMFVNKYIPGIVPNDFFKQVVTSVISSGRNLSKRENISVPLMYEWYEEYYLGGAHGIAGILYLILQVSFFYLTTEQIELVRPTVDFLIGIRYSSGNFPSSLGSNNDRLVHWCHGAPGSVQMLCAAYQVFRDQKYLTAAELCGDVVWERGLLRKGYGICHGVAGNAYTFLILYQTTRDIKHLYRACKFAEWCTTYNQYQERVPDRPYSLFEGLAGTIYFLNDIQDPLNARFPGFTI
ncbi:conserved hypothetical protein [Pediculus humanus corporis]|uniref:Uncharacterized protein n=1 Tax=Pediculus humanus subsp. corporis TaxID=121224 RepID=E0V943_PEDHC|nr:uncharacterized protein Phum_PHUM003710 [Pediculus humanus corporis]EEB09899.1 conserved hypothetical protein [Pediculus humanus corporis]